MLKLPTALKVLKLLGSELGSTIRPEVVWYCCATKQLPCDKICCDSFAGHGNNNWPICEAIYEQKIIVIHLHSSKVSSYLLGWPGWSQFAHCWLFRMRWYMSLPLGSARNKDQKLVSHFIR